MKDCHPADIDSLKCKLCAKQFQAVSSRVRHEDQGCPAEKSVVLVPTAAINTERVNHRHKKQKNVLSAKSLRIVQMYREYLQHGGTSVYLLSQGKKNLQGASIDTYSTHLTDFLAYIEVHQFTCKRNYNSFLRRSHFQMPTLLITSCV